MKQRQGSSVRQLVVFWEYLQERLFPPALGTGQRIPVPWFYPDAVAHTAQMPVFFLMAQAKPQEKPVFLESEAGDAAVGFH